MSKMALDLNYDWVLDVFLGRCYEVCYEIYYEV